MPGDGQGILCILSWGGKLKCLLIPGYLYYSYVVSGLSGCIETIAHEPEYMRLCSKFEEDTGAYVYHVMETDNPCEKLLVMLFVFSEEIGAD